MFTEKSVKDAAIFFARAVQCLSDRDIPSRYERVSIPGHPNRAAFSCSMIFTDEEMANAAGRVSALDRDFSFMRAFVETGEKLGAKIPVHIASEMNIDETAKKARERALRNSSGIERPSGRAFIDEVDRIVSENGRVTWIVCLVSSDGEKLDLMLYSIILTRGMSELDAKEIAASKNQAKAAERIGEVSGEALKNPQACEDGRIVVPLAKASCEKSGEVMRAIREMMEQSFPDRDIEKAFAMAKLSGPEIEKAKKELRKPKRAGDDRLLREAAVFAQSAGLRSFESGLLKLNYPIDGIMSTADSGGKRLPKIPIGKGMSVFAPANGKLTVPVKLKLSDETEGAILAMFPDSPYIKELVESRRKLKKRDGRAPAIVIRFITEVSIDEE